MVPILADKSSYSHTKNYIIWFMAMDCKFQTIAYHLGKTPVNSRTQSYLFP